MSTEIRGLMQFAKGQIETLTFTPNEKKEPTASLKISAELTPELAAVLDVRDSVFRSDDKPRSRVTKYDLQGMILRDVNLTIPNPHEAGVWDTYHPEDIASFRVEVDGMLARLLMLVRIKGRYLDLVDWFQNTNTDSFEFAIRSAQNEFDFSGKSSGTRVEMSGNQNVAAGKSEENGPLFQYDDVPVRDTISDIVEPPQGDYRIDFGTLPPREPVVVDGRDMGIARTRKQRTRGDGQMSPEEISAEQARAGQIIDNDPFGIGQDEPVFPVGAE